MTPPAHPVQEPRALTAAPQAEAARYALLRRLAPSMRHHLVVNLQPIGMIYEVLDRRLRAAEPNLAEVHESAQKINGFARAALNSSLDVVTWLAPEAESTITPADGVKECLALVATSFSFRGYALRDQGATWPATREVRKCALRNVLTGALIQLTDEQPAPAEIHLSGKESDIGLALTISLRRGEGEQGFSAAPAYRPLTRDDLQALADAEGVQLRRDSDDALCVTFPWTPAPAAAITG
jgi:hypothetical protein